MTRQKPGAGTVDQLPSGRWRVRIRDSHGRQISLGTYATEAEAEGVRKAGLIDLASRERAPVGPLLLRAWGETWHAQRVADGIRGADKEKLVWDARIARDEIGDIPIRDLTPQHTRAWFHRVCASKVVRSSRGGVRVATEKQVSGGTIRHALHVLRSALRAAREAGHVVGDPTEELRVPKARLATTVEPWTWLRVDELARVLTCARYDLEYRAIYGTAIFTGLRQGEQWALRWERLTLDGPAPEVLVSESHDGPTKTSRVRRVPLLPRAVDLLLAWREHQVEAWRKDHGGTFDAETFAQSFVFPSETGGRRARGDDARWAPQTRWIKADGTPSPVAGYRERAGITRRVRFHDLRHTCASHLLQGTWDITLSLVEVRDWLGHTSIDQTERYAHLCADRMAVKVAATRPERSETQRTPVRRDSRRDSEVSHALEPVSRSALFSARPEGVEPPTDGSEVRSGEVSFRGDTVKRDSLVTQARAFLVAAARGETSAEARRALALAAIECGASGPLVARALGDGAEAHASAIDLAALLLETATQSATRASSSG